MPTKISKHSVVRHETFFFQGTQRGGCQFLGCQFKSELKNKTNIALIALVLMKGRL